MDNRAHLSTVIASLNAIVRQAHADSAAPDDEWSFADWLEDRVADFIDQLEAVVSTAPAGE